MVKQRQSIFSILIQKRTLTMLLLLVVMLVVFWFTTNRLVVRAANLMNILNMMAVNAFLTMAIAPLMVSGKIDLSTGATGTVCAMFMAYVLSAGMTLVPALLMTLLVGVVIGAVNAALVNELNMAPFIATLATSMIARGLVFIISSIGRSALGQGGVGPIDVRHPVLLEYGRYLIFGVFYRSVYMLFDERFACG